MCGAKTYGFLAFLVWNRVKILGILVNCNTELKNQGGQQTTDSERGKVTPKCTKVHQKQVLWSRWKDTLSLVQGCTEFCQGYKNLNS